MAICFCNIECDHSLPLSAAGTATNAAFLDDFVAWSALTDNLYFWDYITNFRWSFHAFPNLNSMQQNVKFFRDHGVRWLFEEGTCMHADFFALKCWLISKWMWNPDLPAEPLLQRFFEGYYGPAAPYARAVSDNENKIALASAPATLSICTKFFLEITNLWILRSEAELSRGTSGLDKQPLLS